MSADPTLVAIGYLLLGMVLMLLLILVGAVVRDALVDRFHPLLTCAHGSEFWKCPTCSRRSR